MSHESENCHAIQSTCLNEIERCIESCPVGTHPCPEYPWFLCIRTKRKGWVQDSMSMSHDFEHPERFHWIDNKELRKKKLSITELEIYQGLLGRTEDHRGHKDNEQKVE